jgi:hypothetical protein
MDEFIDEAYAVGKHFKGVNNFLQPSIIFSPLGNEKKDHVFL